MRANGRWLVIAAVLASAGAACRSGRNGADATTPAPAATTATADAPSRPGQLPEHRGIYTTGFEASWFRPCDAARGDTLWWVTLDDRALAQRDSLLAGAKIEPYSPLFVRWRGRAGPIMRAGHMGRGTRYVSIGDIIELRPASGGDCAALRRG